MGNPSAGSPGSSRGLGSYVLTGIIPGEHGIIDVVAGATKGGLQVIRGDKRLFSARGNMGIKIAAKSPTISNGPRRWSCGIDDH